MNDWDCDWWDPSCPWHGLRTLLDPVRLPWFRHRLRPLGPAPLVADIGAGAGFVASALAASGARVVGVDPRPRPGGPGGWAPVRGRAERLPLPDASMDAVVLSEVLEHVGDWTAAIDEGLRVLRPGGRLLVSGPNRTAASWLTLILLAQRFPLTRVVPPDLHEWRRFVAPAELATRLEGAGGRLLEVSGLTLPLRRARQATAAWWELRRGVISHTEAGRRMELTTGRSRAVAYLAVAERP